MIFPASSPADLDDVTQWLFGHVIAGAPRGLPAREASRALFEALGNPQDSSPAIHIVGTAGKGTVGALLVSACVSAGERVVSHQSPHVYDIRERFLLDAQLPTEAVVVGAARQVAEAAASLDVAPTFFALTAALAAVIGRDASIDRQIVEAGIGGRVDATNVFNRSDVLTVITPVGLDHTDVLGTTISEIATEKAAVLHGRYMAVTAPQVAEAAGAIRAAAEAAGVDLVEVEGSVGDDWREVALATAAEALDLLSAADGRARPLADTVAMPGRFERGDWRGVPVIFDGAHNPMKLRGLARSLTADGLDRVVAVVALGVGKELDESASVVASFADAAVVTTFGPPDGEFGPRGVNPDELATALRDAGVAAVVEASTNEGIPTALAALFEGAEAVDAVVVTGSFLHLGAVRDTLR